MIRYKRGFWAETIEIFAYASFADAFALGERLKFRFVVICTERFCIETFKQLLIQTFVTATIERVNNEGRKKKVREQATRKGRRQ